jgi:hypothetical protein
MMMEAVRTSETSVYFNETTQRYTQKAVFNFVPILNCEMRFMKIPLFIFYCNIRIFKTFLGQSMPVTGHTTSSFQALICSFFIIPFHYIGKMQFKDKLVKPKFLISIDVS